MDLHTALRTRRTAHSWLDTPVPDDVLERALAAAHCAPCHRFTWPWRFTLPGPTTRARLFDLGVQLKAAKKQVPVTDSFRDSLRPKMLHPSLVVVSQQLADSEMTRKEDYAACSCAIQNICLSVHADGFHSKWSTGGLTRHPDTYAMLNIASDAEDIIGFVWIGTPARGPRMPERSTLDQHIRRTA